MSKLQIAKTLVAGLLLGAGAAQAAAPSSVDEVPAAWYAEHIVVGAHTATNVSFPAAAYEHGPTIPFAGLPATRPSIAGGRVTPPSSAQENGPKL